jgi:hypothetical protein
MFAKRLFRYDDQDEKWSRKIDEITPKIKFLQTKKNENNIEFKQINYEGDIYHFMFKDNEFVGFSAIRFEKDFIWIDLRKIQKKFQGQKLSKYIFQNIIDIAKQNKIKILKSMPDITTNAKQIHIKQGFVSKGDWLEYTIQ